MAQSVSKDQVFVSYSRRDEDWLKKLQTVLAPLVRNKTISVWWDGSIKPSQKWRTEIEKALARADVGVLLVSPDFLASDFITEEELPFLLDAAERHGIRIIWVLVRNCLYDETPIADHQAAHDIARPLNSLNDAELDDALVEIARNIVASEPLDGSSQDAVPPLAGRIEPALSVVRPDTYPPAHRPLLRDVERSIAGGDLRDSLLAPLVLEALSKETELELAKTYDPAWLTTGIRHSDEYFVQVRQGAGHRDWQKDFAQTATPILVGTARSLERSPDAQALILHLCDVVATRLRLKLVWTERPDELNELNNAIYRACIDATELESDDVIIALKGLTVVGPK